MKLDIGAENNHKTFLSYIKLKPNLKNSKKHTQVPIKRIGHCSKLQVVTPAIGEVIAHVCLMKGVHRIAIYTCSEPRPLLFGIN